MSQCGPSAESTDQLDIATGVLLSLLRMTFENMEAQDKESALTFLRIATEQCREQGSAGAAQLLTEWAEDLGADD